MRKQISQQQKRLNGTYVSFTKEQLAYLKHKKKKSKMSRAAVVREALDTFIYNDRLKERVIEEGNAAAVK